MLLDFGFIPHQMQTPAARWRSRAAQSQITTMHFPCILSRGLSMGFSRGKSQLNSQCVQAFAEATPEIFLIVLLSSHAA